MRPSSYPGRSVDTGRRCRAATRSPVRCNQGRNLCDGTDALGLAHLGPRHIVGEHTADCGERGLTGAHSAPATGSVTRNVAPRVGLFSAAMAPLCASMIDRAMASPMPIPVGFVL